jgi:GST-like protein
MFQMGGMGPMLGQTHHFLIYAPEKIDYAVRRYTKETARLYGVLDQALSKSEFVAGDYSIADMAILPWVVPYKRQGQDLADFPNVRRWFDALRSRPAVAKGLDVGKDLHQADVTKIDERTREVLFGASQFKK